MNLRLWLAVSGVALLLALLAGWRLRDEAMERERLLRRQAEHAETLAVETNRIMERNRDGERAVMDAAHDARGEVLEQPGADTPVPDDVLAAWRDGLGRVRAPRPVGDAERGSR